MAETKKPAWPEDVEIITLNKIEMLGVHKKTEQLYWNGHPVITKHELGRREYRLASLAAWATVAAAAFAGLALLVQIFGG
ncbi:hypothetical protein [Aminobacter ciceronei]|jgi:hypothetical protein|uniref:hypothetical protein n=1 Tax=Aminobacter ciceronei TaxID=150723 RepID=UPI003F71F222